jgi:adenosine deaminase
VLNEIEIYPATQAALIVSVDRYMSDLDVGECVSLAIEMKNRSKRVAGIDVCGDPREGDMRSFTQHLSRTKGAGLGLTVRIAEHPENTTEDSLALLSCRPDRLGHATFLSDGLKALFFADIPQTECGPMCNRHNKPLHTSRTQRWLSPTSPQISKSQMQMSFWADTKKSPGRPAINDTEEVIKQVLRVAK